MTRRLPWVSGIMFGVGTGLFYLYKDLVGGGSAGGAVLSALVRAAILGPAYGWLFTRMLLRAVRRLTDRVYAGDPKLIPPPPDGYLYRLPCGWVRRPNMIVGGVLYLGPGGMRFDPHLRNLARFRETLIIAPLKDVQLELVEMPAPRRLWIWGQRTLPRILVRWDGGEARFGVPGAEGIFAILQNRVTSLKQATPSIRQGDDSGDPVP